jgi:hypothetical protein
MKILNQLKLKMSHQDVPIPNGLTELGNDFYKETMRKKKFPNG